VTYNAIEDVYLLASGRKVKRLDIIVYGAPPSGLPFQWRAALWPPTEVLTQAERQEIAEWFGVAMSEWASLPDPAPSEADRPTLIVLDRSMGALS
jgi:hypothetical protein